VEVIGVITFPGISKDGMWVAAANPQISNLYLIVFLAEFLENTFYLRLIAAPLQRINKYKIIHPSLPPSM
jgi:hypothetical protein